MSEKKEVKLSPEAIRIITLLREDNAQNISDMFNTLLDQLCALTDCAFVGGDLDSAKAGEIMLTIRDYKNLLSSLLDDPEDKDKE